MSLAHILQAFYGTAKLMSLQVREFLLTAA